MIHLFIGQSCFFSNGAQLCLIFQMLYYTLKRLGYSGMVVSWKVSSNKICVPIKQKI